MEPRGVLVVRFAGQERLDRLGEVVFHLRRAASPAPRAGWPIAPWWALHAGNLSLQTARPPHTELGPRLRLWVWHSGRSPRSPRYTLGSPGPNLTVGIVPTRTVGILLESRLHVQRLRGRALGKRLDVLLRVWFVWVGSGPACGVLRHPMWTRGRRRGQGVSYPLGSTLGGCRA